jgi:glycosyltransferase involved in cell wall biosynthesis
MSSVRILMYCPFFPPQYSGAAKQALALAARLRILNHKIEFVTIRDADLPDHDLWEGFPVHRLEVNGRRNNEFPLWWRLFCFAWHNRNRFDIFHVHGAHYLNSVAGPISRIVGWRSIVKATMSNDDLYGLNKSAAGFLHHLFLKNINAYVAISRNLQSEFEIRGFQHDRIYHIPNGVDTNRFQPADEQEKADLREKLGLPVYRRIFLSVGVFDNRKNIGWLVREWDRQNGYGVDGFLLAIGPQSREDRDGSLFNSLRQIARKPNSNMQVLDYSDKIEFYYRAADFFILPSTNEGLPNVILEAMASGLPCLATRSPGSKDLVIEGKTGFLYTLNSAADFADKLAQLANNRVVEMGRSARHEVQTKYSLDKIALVYSDLYQKLKSS